KRLPGELPVTTRSAPMRANRSSIAGFLRGRAARIWLLAAAIALLCSLAPMLARASLPHPEWSVIPSHIVLVGQGPSGAADPVGPFTCQIRLGDPTLPARHVEVRLDFAETPDMEPSLVQSDPNVTGVICSGGFRSVTAMTGEDGNVTLRIVGRAVRT